MALRFPQRAVSTALVLSAALVVGVIALLQYRWTTQASDATATRLADSLQMSMTNWHLNFFRDLTDICLAIRSEGDEATPPPLDTYARRLSRWRDAAPYPGLVTAITLSDGAAPERTFRLQVPSDTFGRLRPEDLPVPVRAVHALGVDGPTFAAGDSPAARGTDPFYVAGAGLRGWTFEPTIPALVRRVPYAPGDSRGAATGLMIIELSLSAIESRVLPELAHRYFNGTDGLDFLVAVVEGTPPFRVIYSTDPGFGDTEVPDADGRMNVFGRAVHAGTESAMQLFHSRTAATTSVPSLGTAWFPLTVPTSPERDWRLVVRHRRGGALGTFVAETYRRELVISFGALLLLVMAMAMLMIVSHRAQRLARLQMEFVTAVSHDLRTPLTIISSAADNIAHGVVTDASQVSTYGSVIGSQARKLSGLVERVLLFAAIREERQRYSLSPVAVSDLVEATIVACDELMHAAQFTVVREVEPGLPRVLVDAVAVSQCLQNLITNALKYGASQRWIGIHAGRAAGPEIREVRISVSDRGIGIEPSELPHIFEPFYRSPSVASGQIRGTGLGLSLARRLAEDMKGQLTVTSVPGRGSTFTLHLPIAPDQTSAAVAAPASGGAGAIIPPSPVASLPARGVSS